MRQTFMVFWTVVTLSLAVAASSMPTDPHGGIIQGFGYLSVFEITGPTIPAFNPFDFKDFPFCQTQSVTFNKVKYTGPDCAFSNEFFIDDEPQTITSFNLDFTPQVGTISCFNDEAGGTTLNQFCTPSPSNIVFSNLNIPATDWNYSEGSQFNILFGAIDTNGVLTDAWKSTTSAAGGLNGTPPPSVPEPSSAYLLLGSIGCLFGLMRLKRHLKT